MPSQSQVPRRRDKSSPSTPHLRVGTYRVLGATPAQHDLGAVERAAIEQALIATGGNKVKAARLLGIDRTTLYRKLRYRPLSSSQGPDSPPHKPTPRPTPAQQDAMHAWLRIAPPDLLSRIAAGDASVSYAAKLALRRLQRPPRRPTAPTIR